MNHTLKTNVDYIKENYKSSTIPRLMEHFGYKTLQEINECQHLAYTLIYYYNERSVQSLMFAQLEHCRRLGKTADLKTGKVINDGLNTFPTFTFGGGEKINAEDLAL
jgi:hypothetical protein